MDPLTIAAICTLIVKGQAAVTAVPNGTNCGAVVASSNAAAARASARVRNAEDIDAIGRVAWAEAANQGDRGIAAVVYTIVNRLGDGRWGHTVSQVLNSPRQFEPVLKAGGDWRNLPPVPAERRPRMDAIVALALRGELADETGGALYFQNPTIVAARERAGQVSRGLTNFGGRRPTAVIGAHAFYRDDGARHAPAPAETNQDNATSEQSDLDRQREFIEAGGAIFSAGTSSAAAQVDPVDGGNPSTHDPDSRSVEKAPEQGTRIARSRSVEVSEDGSENRDRVGEQAGSGMFVLPNGRTSSGPPR